MMDAIFRAILKELMAKYPLIAWASIFEQVKNLGPGTHEHFQNWWALEMELPFPGMEGQENPGEPYDPGKV